MLSGNCGSTECSGDCRTCDFMVEQDEGYDRDLEHALEDDGGLSFTERRILDEWDAAGGIYAVASQLVRAELEFAGIKRGAPSSQNETPPTNTP